MKFKKMIALLLAAVLFVSLLAGCAKKTESSEETAAAKYAYQASYLTLPEGVDSISCVTSAGDKAYLAADMLETDDNGNTEYKQTILCADLSSGEVKNLNISSLPTAVEGWDGDTYINCLHICEDGSLLLAYNLYMYRTGGDDSGDGEVVLYDDTEVAAAEAAEEEITEEATEDIVADYGEEDYAYEDENQIGVLHLAADGSLIEQVELTGLPEELAEFAPNSFALTDDMIYASDYSTVCVFDAAGAFQFSLDCADGNGDLICIKDNEVGTTFYSYNAEAQTSSNVFRPIDITAKDWGEEMKLPSMAYSFMPGNDTYDAFYQYNGNIFGYIASTDTTEKVVDWMDYDLNSNNLSNVYMLDNNRAMGIFYDYMSETSQLQVVVLNRVEASQVAEKTVLTMACMGLDWNLREKIVEFNRSSDEYRIVVQDYSEYATDENYYAGLTKLNTEIMSGSVPDIFCAANLPMDKYASMGILTDMYALIDADTSFTRDSFVQAPIKALEKDGKLYEMPLTFYVGTALGLESVVGGYDTWNLASLQDAMSKLNSDASVFNVFTTQSDALQNCVGLNISAFVDWENKACHFDSDDFIAILNFVKQFPASIDTENFDYENDYEEDWQRLNEGKQLLTSLSLSSLDGFVYDTVGLKEDYVLVGYPSEDGTANSAFSFDSAMAISETCQNKDAAWAFVSSMLTEEYQDPDEGNIWSFPINQAAFDKEVEEYTSIRYDLDENGQPYDWDGDGEPDKSIITYFSGNTTFPEDYQVLNEAGEVIAEVEPDDPNALAVYAISQADADKVLDLINSTTIVASNDTDIMDIITDECAAFFAGSKTAEETADMVQSRVSLYVKEQG